MPRYNLNVLPWKLYLQAGNSESFVATIIHWILIKKQRNRIMKKGDELSPCSCSLCCFWGNYDMFWHSGISGEGRRGREAKLFGGLGSRELLSCSCRGLSPLLFGNQTITMLCLAALGELGAGLAKQCQLGAGGPGGPVRVALAGRACALLAGALKAS